MKTLIAISVAMALVSNVAIGSVVDEMQATFEQQASAANSNAGKALWNKSFTDTESGQQRSCTSCHGEDAYASGKHVRTGKVIEPIAPSATPLRFTERRKINKWFKRNCKWTLGRECSAQEKADLLSFLKTL
ncbi:DUF1924 domain-containing protein [Pseudomonadota bacterium]